MPESAGVSQARVTLQRHPSGVRRARHFARNVLRSWGMDEGTGDDAILVVSELVTNAVHHNHDERVELELHRRRGAIRIVVCDAGRSSMAMHLPDAADERGFGLNIVAGVSLEWGVDYLPDGKAVWADLPIARQRAPRDSGGSSNR